MADAPVTLAPTTEQPKADGAAAAEADPVLEIVLEGMKEPVKVPVSKIPVDKLNPHLAKLRSEADRRMSEADKRTKELDARAARYDSVEKLAEAVQKDPHILRQLATELGVTKEALRKLSEEEVAEAIREQIRAEEETKDPTKKDAREQREELEQLRKEREELQKLREQQSRDTFKRQSEGFILQSLQKGGWGPGTPLATEAAREMVPILRAAVQAAKDDLSDFTLTPEELAKKAKEALRRRSALVYDEDAEAELTPKQLEKAKAMLAKAGGATHPATGPGGKGKGNSHRPGKAPPNAGDVLLGLLKQPLQ